MSILNRVIYKVIIVNYYLASSIFFNILKKQLIHSNMPFNIDSKVNCTAHSIE